MTKATFDRSLPATKATLTRTGHLPNQERLDNLAALFRKLPKGARKERLEDLRESKDKNLKKLAKMLEAAAKSGSHPPVRKDSKLNGGGKGGGK